MSKAFLIGAGATRAEYPQAPLSNDFLGKLKAHENPLARNLFAKLKEATQTYLKKPLEESNIEDVMQLSSKFYPEIKRSFLGNLYSAIYVLLADSTQSNKSQVQKYVSGETPRPDTMLKTLLTGVDSMNDFFMTLNYDLCLDSEVLALNRRSGIDYGIDQKFIGERSPYGNVCFNQLNVRRYSVYHLHGSLNLGFRNDGKIDIHVGAILPQYLGEKSTVCIVPPGEKYLNPVLKSIWHTVEERLLKADELIIIGCSLNPDDKELLNLIKKGPDKIKVIDWDESLVKTRASVENALNTDLGKRYMAYHYGFRLHPPSGGQRAFDFIFS